MASFSKMSPVHLSVSVPGCVFRFDCQRWRVQSTADLLSVCVCVAVTQSITTTAVDLKPLLCERLWDGCIITHSGRVVLCCRGARPKLMSSGFPSLPDSF